MTRAFAPSSTVEGQAIPLPTAWYEPFLDRGIVRPRLGAEPLEHRLAGEIRGFAAAGTTVIVSSHILSEVQQMADTIGIICGGRLAYEDALRPGQDLEELFMSFCREGRRARGEVAA